MDFMPGRHFLQIPGPTNVPDRVLRAVAKPTIDHRGPEFSRMAREVLEGLRQVCRTSGPVVIYPSSGTGAWEAALVNTLSSGDRVLMVETGHFATLWRGVALRHGLDVDFVATDWRHGVDPAIIEEKLAEDRERKIKAVAIVHNETSTGVTSRVAQVRKAIDRASHPALFIVDTISSLASIDYRHEEWGVDVTVGGSQKGLMLPPGLSFNAISAKALAASKSARMPKSYWDWEPMLGANKAGFFPYTPPTNLLYGLQESLKMLLEEGLENVFARHDRHAEATRRACPGLGARAALSEPRGVQQHPHSRSDASRPGRRCLPQSRPGKIQPVPGQRSGEGSGQSLSDRTSGRFQRPDARRHFEWRGNGPWARGRAVHQGRCDGGARLSGAEVTSWRKI